MTIPIDAIDQFSVQTQGNAEVGRNGGRPDLAGDQDRARTISMARRTTSTATSSLRRRARSCSRRSGSRSCATSSSADRWAVRSSRTSCSYFVNYEEQKYLIQNSASATEPTTAYVQAGTALLAKHGIPVNPLSLSVLSLWPQGNKPAGPASASNYLRWTTAERI